MSGLTPSNLSTRFIAEVETPTGLEVYTRNIRDGLTGIKKGTPFTYENDLKPRALGFDWWKFRTVKFNEDECNRVVEAANSIGVQVFSSLEITQASWPRCDYLESSLKEFKRALKDSFSLFSETVDKTTTAYASIEAKITALRNNAQEARKKIKDRLIVFQTDGNPIMRKNWMILVSYERELEDMFRSIALIDFVKRNPCSEDAFEEGVAFVGDKTYLSIKDTEYCRFLINWETGETVCLVRGTTPENPNETLLNMLRSPNQPFQSASVEQAVTIATHCLEALAEYSKCRCDNQDEPQPADIQFIISTKPSPQAPTQYCHLVIPNAKVDAMKDSVLEWLSQQVYNKPRAQLKGLTFIEQYIKGNDPLQRVLPLLQSFLAQPQQLLEEEIEYCKVLTNPSLPIIQERLRYLLENLASKVRREHSSHFTEALRKIGELFGTLAKMGDTEKRAAIAKALQVYENVLLNLYLYGLGQENKISEKHKLLCDTWPELISAGWIPQGTKPPTLVEIVTLHYQLKTGVKDELPWLWNKRMYREDTVFVVGKTASDSAQLTFHWKTNKFFCEKVISTQEADREDVLSKQIPHGPHFYGSFPLDPNNIGGDWIACYEFVRGESIQSYLARQPKLSEEIKLELIKGLAELMKGMHAVGLSLGNLHLNDVIVDPQGTYRPVDLKAIGRLGDKNHPVSLPLAPPEMLDVNKDSLKEAQAEWALSTEADVWRFGWWIYAICARPTPFPPKMELYTQFEAGATAWKDFVSGAQTMMSKKSHYTNLPETWLLGARTDYFGVFINTLLACTITSDPNSRCTLQLILDSISKYQNPNGVVMEEVLPELSSTSTNDFDTGSTAGTGTSPQEAAS